MIHLGDIIKIHGNQIEPVDCITFGSPCQDLSVAGKRAGLAGERSGLFMEAVRIIKEMRLSTDGLYPTFIIFENVTGLFSSNAGNDFRAVLEELARVEEPNASIPRPANGGRWGKAGAITGNRWSLAWRQLDAQYWGVPQRRKRIALVVDFGGQRAGEILFERTSLSRHPDPCIQTWKAVAGFSESRTVGDDLLVGEAIPINTQIATRYKALGERTGLGVGEDGDPAYTLQAGHEHAVAYAFDCRNLKISTETSGTLQAKENGGYSLNYQNPVAYTTATPVVFDARGNGNGKIVPTITGDHESRITDYTAIVLHQNASGEVRASEVAHTLSTNSNPSGRNTPILVEKTVRWIVRRLTPTECERLQGYPDGWTDIGEWTDTKGKKHKPADSPRYKALGNSIALPQWFWIVQKMKPYLGDDATLGSLFDGIGGFPLVWETTFGKGTARWASEIEEFPIAVTKKHLQEQ